MKKITAFLGCVGVVCFLSGCSEDSSPAKAPEPTSEANSSATETPNTSSSGKSDTTQSAASSSATVIHQQVVISTSSGDYEDPYFSSGIFCWSAECEESSGGESSSSTAASSSSISIEVSISSEAPVYPTVTETQMIDARDNQSYELIRIGNVHWMNTNLRYKPSKGFYCDDNGTDVCEEYGIFYTYSAAQGACPTGWRLPTQEEVEAAAATVDFEWWTIGGRFEINSDESVQYGQATEQGRLWLTPSSSVNSVRIENYDNKTFNFEAASTTERAYNVRCVENATN